MGKEEELELEGSIEDILAIFTHPDHYGVDVWDDDRSESFQLLPINVRTGDVAYTGRPALRKVVEKDDTIILTLDCGRRPYEWHDRIRFMQYSTVVASAKLPVTKGVHDPPRRRFRFTLKPPTATVETVAI